MSAQSPEEVITHSLSPGHGGSEAYPGNIGVEAGVIAGHCAHTHSPHQRVFGRHDDTGEPGGNPRRHGEHEKLDI